MLCLSVGVSVFVCVCLSVPVCVVCMSVCACVCVCVCIHFMYMIIIHICSVFYGLVCLNIIVGLCCPLGQYGVVEAALYRPSPESGPIKVAIKKTKVCLCVCRLGMKQ